MTRQEEIKKEAKNKYPYIKGLPQTLAHQEIFTEGAKWADENPNSNGKELLYVAQKTAERTKKEIISKACDWLENELYEVMAEPNPYYISEVQSKSYNSLEVLINDFKKAMEEQL